MNYLGVVTSNYPWIAFKSSRSHSGISNVGTLIFIERWKKNSKRDRRKNGGRDSKRENRKKKDKIRVIRSCNVFLEPQKIDTTRYLSSSPSVLHLGIYPALSILST